MKTTSKNENKFAAIFQARQDPVPVETNEPATAIQTPARIPVAPVVIAPAPAAATAPEPNRRMGRPTGKGKSSDPAFRQVTTYIPQELHSNATIALRLANQLKVDVDKEDFSELLTRLLANWYEKQTFYRPAK